MLVRSSTVELRQSTSVNDFQARYSLLKSRRLCRHIYVVAFKQLQIITSFLSLELRPIQSLGQFQPILLCIFFYVPSFNSSFPRYSTLFSHLCFVFPFGILLSGFTLYLFLNVFPALFGSFQYFHFYVFTMYATSKRCRQNVTTKIVSSTNPMSPTLMCKCHNVVYHC